MSRVARFALLVAVLGGAALGAWLALPLWLPAAAGALMPTGWQLAQLELVGSRWGLPVIRRAEVRGADCRLLMLEQIVATLRWDSFPPRLAGLRAESLQIDPACRPRGDAAPLSPAPTAFPIVPGGARVDIDRLTVVGWLDEPHRLTGETAGGQLQWRVEGPALDLEGAWDPMAGEGRIGLRRLRLGAGETPAADRLEAEGAIDLRPAGAAGDLSLAGRVGLRLPGRVEVDMDITGRLDVAGPAPPALSLGAKLAGAVVPTGSRLDGELTLGWRDGVATVSGLRLGLDQAVIPGLVALRPELRTAAPLVLRAHDLRLQADVSLAAARINIVDGGKVESPQAKVRLDGDLSGLDWELQATGSGEIGPVTGSGRLDSNGLAGRLRLAGQALPSLQVLLPPTSPVGLEDGSASLDLGLQWVPGSHGPRLEGEGAVSNARIALTHGVATGVDARAVFTYADGTWRVDRERPATLAVERIDAAVPAEAGRARVSGAWPYNARDPLRIEGLRVGCLGGAISLNALSLPSSGTAVTLALRGIRLEQVSALYGDRTVSLSGTVDGDLPLRAGRDGWTVESGVLKNRSSVRIRLSDADALAVFKRANPGLADAADWLSDLEVSRLDATVDLQADGTLVLVATIEGHNPQRADRPVRLNYRHEENLFQLLQSLRIGSDLGRDIEQRLSPQQRSR